VAKSLSSDFRRFFLRGLAAFLPTLLTIWVIISVVTFVDQHIGSSIDTGVQWLIHRIMVWSSSENLPIWAEPSNLANFWKDKHLNFIGFGLAIVGIYFFGKFIASFVGRTFWRVMERGFLRLPIIRQIYPYIKQVTDFLLSEQKMKFTRVVAVEYPRKGIWAMGLVTGAGMKALKRKETDDLLTVFIPSSPMPVTGYTITVSRDEVIDVPLSIDEALRFTVSGGVIMPTHQQASEKEIDQARYKALPGGHTKENSA